METIIRDVTLETVNQAIANRAGIKPGENFSVVVVESVRSRPRLNNGIGKVRSPAASNGPLVEGEASEPDKVTKSRKESLDRLLSKAGIGIALIGSQTTEDIDRRIREFRGDE
jgi:hypothetical protein